MERDEAHRGNYGKIQSILFTCTSPFVLLATESRLPTSNRLSHVEEGELYRTPLDLSLPNPHFFQDTCLSLNPTPHAYSSHTLFPHCHRTASKSKRLALADLSGACVRLQALNARQGHCIID